MRTTLRASALALLFVSLAAHATAGEGDTPITDPDLLVRLGFPADARDVYLAKGAVIGQKSSATVPHEFGTTDFGWTTVLGDQHHPRAGGSAYLPGSAGSIYYTAGPNVFQATLQLPSGALLRQVTFFVRDNEGSGFIRGSVVRICQTGFPTEGPPVATVLGFVDTEDGDTKFTIVVPPGEVINNFSCAYFASTVFGFASNQLELRKIRAGWQRQVSLAPLTATFPNDTPTTHPYFRFIEALAASGITAGCAPQSYCPNNPITRGEMAVFLAVALGLHWP
jgi:hypothetical protein